MIALTLALLQAQTVSFSHRADFLKNVVPDLGKAVGETLTVDDAVKWQIVYTRVKNVDRKLLLDNFAKATHGVWGHDKEGHLQLVHDTHEGDAAAAVERVECRTYLQSQQQTLEKDLAAETRPELAKFLKARLSILKMIGIERIVALKPGTRTVFSTAPTAMQKRMAIEPELVTSILTPEKDALERPFESKPIFTDEENHILQQIHETQKELAKPSPLAKINIAIGRGDGYATFVLEAFNQQGNSMQLGRARLMEGLFSQAPSQFQPPPEGGETGRALDVPKDIAAQAFSILRPNLNDRDAQQPKIQPLFDHVTKGDPFMDLDQAVFEAYSKINDANIIVDTTNLIFAVAPTSYSESVVWTALQISKPDPNEWILTSPRASVTQIDRDWMEAAIVRLKKRPFLSLDDAAEVSTHIGDASPMGVAMFRWFGWPAWSDQGLELYAALSPDQREIARKSGSLRLGELKGAARQKIYDATFQIAPSISWNPESSMRSWFYEHADEVTQFKERLRSLKEDRDYLQEPTEAMPTGLPADGVIQFAFQTGACYTSSPFLVARAVSPAEACDNVIRSTIRNEFMPDQQITQYYAASGECLKIAIRPNPKYLGEVRVNVGTVNTPTKRIGSDDLKNLHPELWEEHMKMADAIRAEYKRFKDFGREAIPPP